MWKVSSWSFFRTCPLYFGASFGVPCLSSLLYAMSVLRLLPLAIQRASSWSLFAHAHFILGRPVECLSVWPPSCIFGSSAPTLLLYGGLLLGASFAHARFILGRPVECQSAWPPSCDFLLPLFYFWASSWVIIRLIPFHPCFSLLELSFGCVSSSLIIQSSWVLAFSRRQHIFAFIAGLFKDKVYPLLISSWH